MISLRGIRLQTNFRDFYGMLINSGSLYVHRLARIWGEGGKEIGRKTLGISMER